MYGRTKCCPFFENIFNEAIRSLQSKFKLGDLQVSSDDGEMLPFFHGLFRKTKCCPFFENVILRPFDFNVGQASVSIFEGMMVEPF